MLPLDVANSSTLDAFASRANLTLSAARVVGRVLGHHAVDEAVRVNVVEKHEPAAMRLQASMALRIASGHCSCHTLWSYFRPAQGRMAHPARHALTSTALHCRGTSARPRDGKRHRDMSYKA